MQPRQIGPFIIEKQIGVGGMGVVYLATYTETDKKVALKLLTPGLSTDPRMLRRFEREIDILKRLNHPNIVRYYGGGTTSQQRWYAMEFINGGSLQDVLKKRGRLNWEQAIQVGRQLCSALEHAHNAGIIHRDLKPANLFISKNGRLKLGDFGIARDTEATALTAAGKTVGTYAYMAPEQIHGNAPISKKTDLYAAGCLLFEVLTGQTPFVSDNPAEMLMQHVNDDPPDVRELAADCPIWLDQLIDRMLAKNPDDRPYDALAVHTELTGILEKMHQQQVQASAAGIASAGATSIDPATGDLKPAKKKKKKKKDLSEFYEQTWFLLLSLAIVVAVGIWLMLPPGEETLYLSAREGFTSKDESVQRDARDRFMLPYLERYPDGRFHEEVQQWVDDIEIRVLEAQAEKKSHAPGRREPRNDLERDYIAALLLEQDAERNPLEAIELYQALIDRHSVAPPPPPAAENAPESALPDATETRYWVTLATRHRDAVVQRLLEMADRDRWLTLRMQQAETWHAEGRGADAGRTWKCLCDVFRGNEAVEKYYTYARHRLNGEPAQIPHDAGQANTESAAHPRG